ncbi:hypothetical protein [Aureicoccus marinus]|uniref:Glycerophosphoryl diester phosphodiesterase membrane domain-containing protein n=1 Tax=Aureicoccus marinus TaxID=754435 RepID=A0A2S7T6C7_9FLAO|nr:hypothetical protein [Aureicoccus marinus]PQJ15470.1 hypothetical protein BST99_06710 [Aureicoccus marinus]
MNTKNFVNFRRQRDLGEVLSDTFRFIRLEFRSFMGAILKISGPYLLILLAATGAYLYYFGEMMSFQGLMDNNETSEEEFIILFGVLAVLMISGLVTYIMSNAAVICYIQNYTANNGKTDYATIKRDSYQNFWPLMGLGILIGLTVLLGLMICILPGIYLAVPLALSIPILIIEKRGVGDSFSGGFNLVSGQWWNTFFVLLVMYIIIMVANYAFALPSIIYMWIKMGVFTGEVDAESMNVFNDPIYLAINILSSVVQFLMRIILLVSIVLVYFNLHEQKTSSGAMGRISDLGNSESLH